MASSFNLTPAIQVLSCPNCGNTINTTLAECSYCGNRIEATAAAAGAAMTSRVNAACSDASYLRTLVTMAAVFFGLRFLPFLGLIGLAGTWFLRFALPIMCIRWWIKYRALHTSDPDFARARTTAILVSAAAVLLMFTVAIHIR